MHEGTFDQGVLWAVARLVEWWGNSTAAEELLRESGVDVGQADEADTPFIAKVVEGCKDGQEEKT